jgi:ATP citrate (pro-S)-lyase
MAFLTYSLSTLCFFIGRETPSVAGIINPGSDGFQKLFFGQEEIAIPVHPT